jgi:HD-GYP domain-containing protein (c-di-GMP phosphodiesterase class II)
MAVNAASPPGVPAHAEDLVGDELIRDARSRRDDDHLDRRALPIFAGVGIAVAAAAAFAAITVHGGAAFSAPTLVMFTTLYVLVSRVEFEVGTGSAIPTQLVLVPMLFALPAGLAPAAVAVGLLVPAIRDRASIMPRLASSGHALGPALVFAYAGGFPLRWQAWPVYAAALGAQFALDFATSAPAHHVAHGVPLRTLARFMGWVWLVDAALAPIGLAIAFATRDHTWLVVLVLPLVGLLRYFAQERQRRIDHALELSDAYRGTAFLLGDVVEADDAYTGSHSRHVVDLVVAVADELGLDATARRDAEFVALLHDVGKIRIPGEIINKPGALDREERALIETHTIEGQLMLEQVGGLLGKVGRLVRSCHERWDGAGYPDGLAGNDIPLVARIVCACDAYSAMTTDRPYRAGRTEVEALEEMKRCAGTQFDPRVVGALAAVVSP